MNKGIRALLYVAAVIAGLLYLKLTDWSVPAPEPMAPAIGGAFTLTDQDGSTITEAQLNGRFSLVFFGFTQCPDVCPATLHRVDEAMESLGQDAANVRVVFISVDPERDSPEVIKQYLSTFKTPMLGLTGTPEQTAQVEQAYKVFAKKEGDQMQHTGLLYLLDREGRYLAHFDSSVTSQALADALEQAIDA